MRLDLKLVALGLASSRERAKSLILARVVLLDGVVCAKPSFLVGDEEISIVECGNFWASRSGYKLDGFLENSKIDITNKSALDIGSSTGGFTDVLLFRGIKSVVCVDVGTNQLSQKLRDDSRVSFYENCDIRDFESENKFDVVVCDVSFISLRILLEKIYALCSGICILLFKPQFEVGRGVKRNKKGVIMDKDCVQAHLDDFLRKCVEIGFVVVGVEKSVLKGKSGNEEFFINLQK